MPANESNTSLWTHPPFGGVVSDDGYIYGRGTADIKSMLTAELEAVEQLIKNGSASSAAVAVRSPSPVLRPCGLRRGSQLSLLRSHHSLVADMLPIGLCTWPMVTMKKWAAPLVP